MIKQGETISFDGKFSVNVGGVQTVIDDLSAYQIRVLITNKPGGNILFSTDSENEDTRISVDGSAYKFSIKPHMSVNLYGVCNVEVALIKDGEAVISDNNGTFYVNGSELGRVMNNG